MKYKHLSLIEREWIMVGLAMKMSFHDIAKEINRGYGTIQKEVHRNAKYYQKYIASVAQRRYEERTCNQRRKAPLKSPEIYLYVREHLRPSFQWSPETIAGRLTIDHPGDSICHETIYAYIDKNKREKLWRFLKLAHKKRKKKGHRKVRNGRIPGAISIDVRPKVVTKRKHPGHWESDLMEGKKSTAVVSATVERSSRYTLLTKVGNKKADTKVSSLVKQIGKLPADLRKTLTLDNGMENTNHVQITNLLGVDVYFCHAYHSWEKGTVENTIGRLRRYLPKGMDLTPLTDENLQLIQNHMNHTPRKCLGYFTPYEKMNEYLNSSTG